MVPAEALIAPLEKTVVFGGPKFTWLSTLKNSARNSRLVRSDNRVFLKSDTSTSANPGPVRVPLPKFP